MDPTRVKSMVIGLLTSDPDFRKEVTMMVESMKAQQDTKNVDDILANAFPGANISPWKANDQQGTVYGWPEDIAAKVIKKGNEISIAPIVDGVEEVDKAHLAVYLRIGLLYESMNRFALGMNRAKIVIVAPKVSETARTIATQWGATIL